MRGKKAPKRDIRPDEVYNSATVSKLINYVMLSGKKNIATKNVYLALQSFANKLKIEGEKATTEHLEKALSNIKPNKEIRSKRVGGSNLQVPTPVSPERQVTLAFRWLIAAARKARGSKPFYESLAKQLTEAYNGEGEAVRKKEDTHKMADANKAFAQFA